MAISLDNSNSSQPQFQPGIRLQLPNLPGVEYQIVMIPQSQNQKPDVRVKNELDPNAKDCNRLIAIIIKYAKSQGKANNLPYLKSKSYEELCVYIEQFWPVLIPQI
ncbi:hypothetical protein [Cuspidothrix issatschenkoi]|jgi:hypothetical protein|uniref:Uncharacterized protein n=1 Tax=Cuspidothrix issatschenkoi CHARLIE-1 TaxID=2052836 RepID=A0A2S6CTW1_9CYAN|nr:hypothetical protein [Cuspidothrix issatschenkoi]PPJ63131.1 hypothetical protein CUN59_11685 [Cuspidothrix issatschenkoi CHARLIE-1]